METLLHCDNGIKTGKKGGGTQKFRFKTDDIQYNISIVTTECDAGLRRKIINI